jgi:hypothetical protein
MKALTNIRAPVELQLFVGLLFAHQQIPLGVPKAQYKCAETTPTFLCMVPILRRFRIVRCNRQAALYSVQFNYTPLEIRRIDKNTQLTIVKPTQTGINRNK